MKDLTLYVYLQAEIRTVVHVLKHTTTRIRISLPFRPHPCHVQGVRQLRNLEEAVYFLPEYQGHRLGGGQLNN